MPSTVVTEWPEGKRIATAICRTFRKTFRNFDVNRVKFVMSDRNASCIAKVYPVKHPWNMLSNKFDYIIEFIHASWMNKPDSVKHLAVFHEMKHIPKGGFDSESKEYRKIVRHDIEDFAICIAKAAGVKSSRVIWTNSDDVPDILAGVAI